MKIYFGEVVQAFQDEGDFINEKNGKHYYYMLESDEEQINLIDTCDRFIPFGHEEVGNLMEALMIQQHYSHKIQPAREAFEVINSDEVFEV